MRTYTITLKNGVSFPWDTELTDHVAIINEFKAKVDITAEVTGCDLKDGGEVSIPVTEVSTY